MGKIVKFAILVAVVLAVLWTFATFTGNAVTIGAANKKKCTLARRRRVDGKLWQTSGVDGPGNVLINAYAPPLAPVNPIGL